MFLGGQWVFWGASGFSDSLAPRASGCHSPMSRPELPLRKKASNTLETQTEPGIEYETLVMFGCVLILQSYVAAVLDQYHRLTY